MRYDFKIEKIVYNTSAVFLGFNTFAITTIKKPGNFQTRVHIIAEYVILEKYTLSR